METPFTKEEQEIIDLLVEAHNKVIRLPDSRKFINEWVAGIHACQNVMIVRMVSRLYPNIFN